MDVYQIIDLHFIKEQMFLDNHFLNSSNRVKHFSNVSVMEMCMSLLGKLNSNEKGTRINGFINARRNTEET